MIMTSLKKTYGTRKVKKLLNVYYEGEVLVNLVSELYPLVDRVGYESLEKIVGFCNQLAGDHSGRTAVTLLEESPELIDRLLMYGDKVLVLNVYGLCSQVAGYSEGPIREGSRALWPGSTGRQFCRYQVDGSESGTDRSSRL